MSFAEPVDCDAYSLRDAEIGIVVDGYVRGRCDALLRNAGRLADAIGKLVKLEIPIPFLFLFDEAWQCFAALHPLLVRILGRGYKALPDFWAWHVGPGERGWAPHRDRGRKSLAPHGVPLALTVWIPLSEANVDNSCIHILPPRHDKTYGTERELEFDVASPEVRPMPASLGEYLCWNQSVLHWGSEAGTCPTGPRMSLAAEFQRGDIAPFNEPLIAPLATLHFGERLVLIAKQLYQYRHTSLLSPEWRSWAHITVHGDCALEH
jgi:ectoine hydroxylase-related dioxygenase (phytanoyl-CoA dioxygenase family)